MREKGRENSNHKQHLIVRVGCQIVSNAIKHCWYYAPKAIFGKHAVFSISDFLCFRQEPNSLSYS